MTRHFDGQEGVVYSDMVIRPTPEQNHSRGIMKVDQNSTLISGRAGGYPTGLLHRLGREREEARNRKLLRENPLADWELRVGNHRVFYKDYRSYGS